MTTPQNPKNNVDKQQETIPTAEVLYRKRISSFWLLPFIALCIGIILLYQLHQEKGREITIYFSDGAGLVANKTEIRYQGLQVGVVRKVNFTDDLKLIQVTADIYPEAETLLREDTKFWIVQPSASLAGISGLDALVSGNYITLSPGYGKPATEFVALSQGPVAEVTAGDLSLVLIADSLGSISLGAKVYYRKVPVGKVNNYHFLPNKKIAIDLVINKQYADLVRQNSHFWNTSGIQADLSLSGIKVNVDSLDSIIQGAITFDSPDNSPPAINESTFTLYPSLTAAKRGIKVGLVLPADTAGLTPNKTPVYYKNMHVGVLAEYQPNFQHNNVQYKEMPTSLTSSDQVLGNEQDRQQDPKINAELLLEPSMQFLLRTGTKIILRERPSLSSGDLTQFIQGKSFEIIAGEGEPQQQFVVIKQSDLLLHQIGTLVVHLRSTQSYGIEVGQPLLFNGIEIGNVVKRQVKDTTIYYTVAVAREYRHLINPETKFIVASNFNLSLGVDGLKFSATSPQTWLRGGISIITGKPTAESNPLAFYPLYKDLSDAQAGIDSNNLQPTIVLHSQQLPSINVGSAVLYHHFPVGQILSITPDTKQFKIGVFIQPQYRHLLTKQSRFWAESAVEVNLSLQGAKIQAAPLQRVLLGAISFAQLAPAQIKQADLQLYLSQQQAKSVGQQIVLLANDAVNLQIGLPLRYLGVKVGEITQIQLVPQQQQVKITALLFAENFKLLARNGSSFQLITPQISGGGVQNIESLLQPYIKVEAGQGRFSTQFKLQDNNSIVAYQNGFPLVLETVSAINLSVNSPVLYRGVEVGIIKKISLNQDADRALVEISLAKKYQHLVRQNSQFWVASGYSFNLGWRGLKVQTGTTKQLLQGGIAFSTPSGEVVQPPAKAYQHFLLQQTAPAGSQNWDQGSYPEQLEKKGESKRND